MGSSWGRIVDDAGQFGERFGGYSGSIRSRCGGGFGSSWDGRGRAGPDSGSRVGRFAAEWGLIRGRLGVDLRTDLWSMRIRLGRTIPDRVGVCRVSHLVSRSTVPEVRTRDRVRVCVKYGRPGKSIRFETSAATVPSPVSFSASEFGGRLAKVREAGDRWVLHQRVRESCVDVRTSLR